MSFLLIVKLTIDAYDLLSYPVLNDDNVCVSTWPFDLPQGPTSQDWPSHVLDNLISANRAGVRAFFGLGPLSRVWIPRLNRGC